ncbi:MAG: SpoIVB peptidase [Acutalibacteraceae bacterium]|nr:SpoIVB peptidase [Acutalibacteraceae bacterium]
MKKFIKIICCALSVVTISTFCSVCYYNTILPSNIVIYDNESVHFNTKLEVVAKNKKNIGAVSNLNNKSLENYNSDLSLMGVIPVKSVNIRVVKQRYVALSGESFGIKIFTKGVMVVGMSDVKSDKGNINPAKNAGLKIGDIILKANGKEVNSNTELSEAINISGGKELKMTVKRDDDIFTTKFKPVLSSDTGTYKAGLWVRDSTAGLGTMTFYSTVNGAFAGLGHGIVDVDTGILLPINSGEIVKTEILSVTKSKKGSAGEICGAFTGETLGTLTENSSCGLYGYYKDFEQSENLILIANKQDVKTGNAKIYTTLDNGEPKYYDCVIERVDYTNSEQKNLLVRINDERLIEKTGGIVQGMSGSPIIQNGQLVGALTNVFVNDPEKGYAVFAEEMYDKMIETTQSLNRAS